MGRTKEHNADGAYAHRKWAAAERRKVSWRTSLTGIIADCSRPAKKGGIRLESSRFGQISPIFTFGATENNDKKALFFGWDVGWNDRQFAVHQRIAHAARGGHFAQQVVDAHFLER
jgi:hypothetical protein